MGLSEPENRGGRVFCGGRALLSLGSVTAAGRAVSAGAAGDGVEGGCMSGTPAFRMGRELQPVQRSATPNYCTTKGLSDPRPSLLPHTNAAPMSARTRAPLA